MGEADIWDRVEVGPHGRAPLTVFRSDQVLVEGQVIRSLNGREVLESC